MCMGVHVLVAEVGPDAHDQRMLPRVWTVGRKNEDSECEGEIQEQRQRTRRETGIEKFRHILNHIHGDRK